MSDLISIEGPVEVVYDDLMLRIPLSVGGAQLAPLARGIGEVRGDFLCVVIQPWLAESLGVRAGSRVIVDNANGKFTITPTTENPGRATADWFFGQPASEIPVPDNPSDAFDYSGLKLGAVGGAGCLIAGLLATVLDLRWNLGLFWIAFAMTVAGMFQHWREFFRQDRIRRERHRARHRT